MRRRPLLALLLGRSRQVGHRSRADFYIERAKTPPASATKPTASATAAGRSAAKGGSSAVRVAAATSKGAGTAGGSLSKQPPGRVPKTPKSAGGGLTSGAVRAATSAGDEVALEGGVSLFADDSAAQPVKTPSSASRHVPARLATLATPRANQSVKAELARQKAEIKGAKAGPGGTVVQPRMMF